MKCVASWFIQLCVATLVPLVLAAFLGNVLGETAGSAIDQVIRPPAWFLAAVIGAVLGYVVARAFPKSRRAGVKVWVLPVAVFAWGLLYDMNQLSPREALIELFSFSGPGPCCLATLFITYPAWCSCCYSAAVRLAAGRRVSLRGRT